MTDDVRTGRARWIVLTPSADDAAWRSAIAQAVAEAGLRFVDARAPDGDAADPGCVFLTDNAEVATANLADSIVAIMPEPETAPDAVAEIYQLAPPADMWHATLLLARALDLGSSHGLVAASQLARHPKQIRLFGDITITPPRSTAEASRRSAVSGALNLFRDPSCLDTTTFAWSEKLFLYDEKGSRSWPEIGVLDTTGRPRVLVWGPYVSLPSGEWRATIRFAVDEDAARRKYRLDWGTQTECVSEYVTPGSAGVYEVELDWRFVTPVACEIRLILTEGSFMGTVMFQGITVQRLPAASIAQEKAA